MRTEKLILFFCGSINAAHVADQKLTNQKKSNYVIWPQAEEIKNKNSLPPSFAKTKKQLP